jgi:hypothetical protein
VNEALIFSGRRPHGALAKCGAGVSVDQHDGYKLAFNQVVIYSSR